MLHTNVPALCVQSVLRCGTKNAQSAAAACDYFEKRYPSSRPREVAEGLLKGLSVCTGCAAAVQWLLDPSPPSEGIRLAKLKMEGLRSGRGGGGADRVSAMGIEDIVDVERMFCTCCAHPLLCFCNVLPRVMRIPHVVRMRF